MCCNRQQIYVQVLVLGTVHIHRYFNLDGIRGELMQCIFKHNVVNILYRKMFMLNCTSYYMIVNKKRAVLVIFLFLEMKCIHHYWTSSIPIGLSALPKTFALNIIIFECLHLSPSRLIYIYHADFYPFENGFLCLASIRICMHLCPHELACRMMKQHSCKLQSVV